MQKRGLTSTELARQSNILTSFLYDVISGKSKNPSTIKLAKVAEALNVSLNYLVYGIEDYIPSTHKYISIPVFASDNANDGDLLFSSKWLNINLGHDINNLKIFTAIEDGMIPTIYPEDTVIIDTSKNEISAKTKQPQIFVISYEKELYVKKLEYSTPQKTSVRVISDNTNYPTFECSEDDLTIIGRVVWLSRLL